MLKGLSIIIPTWNGLFLIKQTLDSVVKAANECPEDTEIIIVDNGSMDRTVDVIKDFYEGVVDVFSLDKNYGFGYACNYGAGKAKYDKLFFLNNDIMMKDENLLVLVNELQSLPEETFSLSPVTNYWNDEEGLSNKVFTSNISLEFKNGDMRQIWGVNSGKELFDGTVETIYGSGAVLLVYRNKFVELGGFDEIYSPAYWEDIDLCLKAWRKKWPSYITNKTFCWHKVSSSTQNNSSYKNHLMERNFYIFYLSNCLDEKENKEFWSKIDESYLEELESKKKEIDIRRKNAEDSSLLSLNEIIEICSKNIHEESWKSPFFFK